MSIQKRFKKPLTPAPVSPISGPRYLKPKAAAAYLSVSYDVVLQLIHERKLPYIPNGDRYILDKLDLDRWMERQKIGVVAA